MSTEPKPNIAAKLAAAIGAVDRIGKDGTNAHFKYTYTSAEQVYRVIRGPLLEHGLVVIPSVAESTTHGDTTITRLHLRLIDTDSGESIEAYWMGEGQDKGDKGPYKAATGGMKTWLKHLFLLPADDDPEADVSTDRRELTGLEKLAAAADRIGLPKSDRQQVGKWLHAEGELDEAKLTKAIQRIDAGDAEGLLALIADDAKYGETVPS